GRSSGKAGGNPNLERRSQASPPPPYRKRKGFPPERPGNAPLRPARRTRRPVRDDQPAAAARSQARRNGNLPEARGGPEKIGGSTDSGTAPMAGNPVFTGTF